MGRCPITLALAGIWVASTMICAGGSAQTLKPHDSGQQVDELAKVIEKSLSLTDTDAKPPSDWCAQIEVDKRENWWYTPDYYTGDNVAHQSVYGNRIRLIYTSRKDNSVIGFASLFMALDLGKAQPYGLLTDRQPLDKGPKLRDKYFLNKTVPVPDHLPNNLGTISFPSSGTICPSFGKVLAMLFNVAVYSWTPIGDPDCDDYADKCKIYPGPDQNPYPTRESFLPGCDPVDPSSCAFVYWQFNGNDHLISGAIRFMIEYRLTDEGPKQTGFLVIGFGGNGGAG